MNLSSEANSSPLIELRSVSKTYGSAEPVAALHPMDLRIEPSERVAIVGPSGSGKTSLLNLLGLLDRPTTGAVYLAGREVSSLPEPELCAARSHEIGFVFQQFFLLEHLNAVENVEQALLYTGATRRSRVAVAVRAMDRVGLAHRLRHKPSQLSGGERQRVAIARAIAGDPSLILADEPTGNLDTQTGATILSVLTESAEDATTVVVVTHDPGVAAAMDRRIEIVDGRITRDIRVGAR
ncbi:ABC transporter ATP-binding protein [Sinomonas sp. G460-2]|uniref:ABC transporter ATP-binding protein n=1 Tax=Sinomonas sp. G460-2 TaxID=3393464 RepID=UPI0039F02F43